MSTKTDILVQRICGGHADRNSAPHAPLYLEKVEWMYRQTGQGKYAPDHSMKVKGQTEV